LCKVTYLLNHMVTNSWYSGLDNAEVTLIARRLLGILGKHVVTDEIFWSQVSSLEIKLTDQHGQIRLRLIFSDSCGAGICLSTVQSA
jgi:hypothetical protein